MTIADAAPRLANGKLKSEKLTEDCLSKIEELNSKLNAFITVTADDALASARKADKEIAAGRYLGPLHGIPVSLKDLLDQKGLPTTAGSSVRKDHVAGSDAVVTARLRDAGAVFVGKTNLHEFAFGTTSEDSAFGPVRNPKDPTRSPGGSSGGSAVAIATGMSLGTVGTDTGGSIRIPAAACGVVGLKPEWGQVSAAGVVPLSRQLDHVGPLATSCDRCVDPIQRDAAARAAGGRGARPDAAERPSPRHDERLPVRSDRRRRRAGDARDHRVAAQGGRDRDGGGVAARHRHAGHLPAPRVRRRRRISRAHARLATARLHAERPAAARDGALRAGRRLHPRAARQGDHHAARSTARSTASTRWCCRRCRFPRRRSAPPPCR